MKLRYYPPENMKKEAVDIKSLFGRGKDVDKNERLYQILQQPNQVFDPETYKLFEDKIGASLSPEVSRQYMNFLVELVVDQFKEYSAHWRLNEYNPEYLVREMKPAITQALKTQIEMLSGDLRKRISEINKAIKDKAVKDKAAKDAKSAEDAKSIEEGGLTGTASVTRKNITKIAAQKLHDDTAKAFLAAIKSNPVNYQKQMNQSLLGPMQGWFQQGLVPSKQPKASEAPAKKTPAKAPAKAPSGGGRANTSLANVFDTINGILSKASLAIVNAQKAANAYNMLPTPEERKPVAIEIKKILESNFFINVEITEESLMEDITVPEKPLKGGPVATPPGEPIPSPAAPAPAAPAPTALTRTGPMPR